MKVLTDRQIQVWAVEWMQQKRPSEIKPFWLTEMLKEFQRQATEPDLVADKCAQPSCADPEHGATLA
jgi:hypothetical protein